jgi:hypothetical protein
VEKCAVNGKYVGAKQDCGMLMYTLHFLENIRLFTAVITTQGYTQM